MTILENYFRNGVRFPAGPTRSGRVSKPCLGRYNVERISAEYLHTRAVALQRVPQHHVALRERSSDDVLWLPFRLGVFKSQPFVLEDEWCPAPKSRKALHADDSGVTVNARTNAHGRREILRSKFANPAIDCVQGGELPITTPNSTLGFHDATLGGSNPFTPLASRALAKFLSGNCRKRMHSFDSSHSDAFERRAKHRKLEPRGSFDAFPNVHNASFQAVDERPSSTSAQTPRDSGLVLEKRATMSTGLVEASNFIAAVETEGVETPFVGVHEISASESAEVVRQEIKRDQDTASTNEKTAKNAPTLRHLNAVPLSAQPSSQEAQPAPKHRTASPPDVAKEDTLPLDSESCSLRPSSQNSAGDDIMVDPFGPKSIAELTMSLSRLSLGPTTIKRKPAHVLQDKPEVTRTRETTPAKSLLDVLSDIPSICGVTLSVEALAPVIRRTATLNTLPECLSDDLGHEKTSASGFDKVSGYKQITLESATEGLAHSTEKNPREDKLLQSTETGAPTGAKEIEDDNRNGLEKEVERLTCDESQGRSRDDATSVVKKVDDSGEQQQQPQSSAGFSPSMKSTSIVEPIQHHLARDTAVQQETAHSDGRMEFRTNGQEDHESSPYASASGLQLILSRPLLSFSMNTPGSSLRTQPASPRAILRRSVLAQVGISPARKAQLFANTTYRSTWIQGRVFDMRGAASSIPENGIPKTSGVPVASTVIASDQKRSFTAPSDVKASPKMLEMECSEVKPPVLSFVQNVWNKLRGVCFWKRSG